MRPRSRYLAAQVRKDLKTKMVFVAGPRQVGKTTMARSLPGAAAGYLNWDVAEHRERILRRELPPGNLWIFDEIHKYRNWRGYLKGLFDGRSANRRIMVTGSARLDLYRRGGDSLQGRYHLLRLHPLSAKELGLRGSAELRDLMVLGGFPEPYFGGSATGARRWSREYRNLLIREEVAGLERIHDLGTLEALVLRLPELVGSPLSLNALKEDLQVSHKTVARWMEVLERLYAVFRIPPFGAPRIRAIRKAQKHYHFDWSLVGEDPQRFENLVAAHLLKWVHFEQDTRGRDLELRYFRDTDGREVDFVVVERRQPLLFVECKWSDQPIDKGIRYLKARFPATESWQVSATGTKDYRTPEGIRVAPAVALLDGLV
ncbi:MAG: ATP-binding protein [Candidatus Eisenbacteria bacterium]|uniref:ATP-binding protein n=1 Tax=Eiseniibacteriota bacterium TaxID=2212470 RepID=A0A937XCL8_UNCEI|nr:ATP-binding protein [Candidatus Eisenbacteria bacterium]